MGENDTMHDTMCNSNGNYGYYTTHWSNLALFERKMSEYVYSAEL